MIKPFIGLEIPLKHTPPLDAGFMPLSEVYKAYEKKVGGGIPAGLAVERAPGNVKVKKFRLEGNLSGLTEADKYLSERLLKSMLWAYGGHRVYVAGTAELADFLRSTYCIGGKREFDVKFMEKIYEQPFEIVTVPLEGLPEQNVSGQSRKKPLDLKGCFIGLDAGGSDIKVSAVIDGETVFSKEIVWLPKVNSNPDYHYKYIVDAMKLAAGKMPAVDGIGVSSAGIYVNNKTMVASLFIKASEADFNEKIKDIYIRAAKELGDIPLAVANDGDVTALAGSMEFNDVQVLGIAMGTSEAGGYADISGQITGWLNELAFVPIDGSPDAMIDEWAGDIGCGVKYFSQDGIIKLAPAAGITLKDGTPAEKLKYIQNLMLDGDERARMVYESIGVYLGYSIPYYCRFYSIKHLLLLGRVMSGEGGAVILEKAKEVLQDEYPEIAKGLVLHLPDEQSRRVGQSIAAASLPRLYGAV